MDRGGGKRSCLCVQGPSSAVEARAVSKGKQSRDFVVVILNFQGEKDNPLRSDLRSLIRARKTSNKSKQTK